MMQAIICDSGAHMVLWWGNGTNVVWQILHLECTLRFFGRFLVICCSVVLHQPHNTSNNSIISYSCFFEVQRTTTPKNQ